MRQALLPIGYALLSVAGGLVFVLTLLGVAIGVRDGFCTHGYPAGLATMFLFVFLFAFPFLGSAAGLAALRLADRPARWRRALAPMGALAMALTLLWLGEASAQAANGDVCLLPSTQRQDADIVIPLYSNAFFIGAFFATVIAALSALWTLILCIGTPSREA